MAPPRELNRDVKRLTTWLVRGGSRGYRPGACDSRVQGIMAELKVTDGACSGVRPVPVAHPLDTLPRGPWWQSFGDPRRCCPGAPRRCAEPASRQRRRLGQITSPPQLKWHWELVQGNGAGWSGSQAQGQHLPTDSDGIPIYLT